MEAQEVVVAALEKGWTKNWIELEIVVAIEVMAGVEVSVCYWQSLL